MTFIATSRGTSWQTYTVLAEDSAGVALSVGTGGNAELEGLWRRVGDSIDVRIMMVFGTTSIITNPGSNNNYWRFSLPPSLTADIDVTSPGSAQHGTLFMQDTDLNDTFSGISYFENITGHIRGLILASTGSVLLRPTVPFTWAINDVIRIQADGIRIVEFS